MTKRDEQLDRLLARGRMGGPARDDVFESVWAKVAPRTSVWSRVSWFAIPAASAAVLAFLFVLTQEQGEFVPKGVARNVPFVTARCDGPCRVGSTLMFQIRPLEQRAFFVAYAEDATGARIEYFPSPRLPAPELLPSDATQLLPHGITLGSEHHAGQYTLHFLLLSEPNASDPFARHTQVVEILPP